MMKKLKIGVLGASRGMEFARRVLAGSPYAEVTAICEAYAPLCQKAKDVMESDGHPVACFTEYDAFLDSGLDAVILCNFANEHAPYAIRALSRGIHVMSEVQPAQSLAEAAMLCQAVEDSGCVYAYAENYCYFDGHFALRQMVEDGKIGEVVSLEGDFYNDCSAKWHMLTRGIRNHWRNFVPSTFYCTHSIAPMFYATGLRATKVNGLEIPRMDYMAEGGARSGSAAMEVMELSNGGMARSTHGNLRYPYTTTIRLIGADGSIESDSETVKYYRANGSGGFEITSYKASFVDFPYRNHADCGAIGNGDYSAVGFFLAKILGDDQWGKYSIDIYQALDMALPGLLAFRSILDGGAPYTVPDFRDPAIRVKYRNDHYCTDPRTPELYRLATSKSGTPDVDEAVYEAVQAKFGGVELTPGQK